ncbi:MAG: DNA repair protein [Eggerthellaceae bacterium]|nr:DNA repair protein [Eggerthellaceae bacterium]
MRYYLCIDLKSFYASVECVERGLDPFTTNLVVADPTRSDKTICLAITPAMKELGVHNRCRVFEIPPGIDYIMAPPHLSHYMEVSAQIYSVYLRYISAEDMHVYSIDECFIDATPYLELYHTTPKQLAVMLMDAVFAETGICATAGIGTNLFLAKVALDITAKHVEDHIGFLDQEAFEREILPHRPITDIWNVGPGIARRLAKYGVYDLAGVAAMEERTLYKEFGVNAEYLIDHAHGYEPCTIKQIHEYVPETNSLCNGQVLFSDYTYDEARIIIKEMVDALILDLVDKHLVTESIALSIGYGKGEEDDDPSPVIDPFTHKRNNAYFDNATRKLNCRTASRTILMDEFLSLFDEICARDRLIRRMNIGFGSIVPEEYATCDLFTSYEDLAHEKELQDAIISVKKRFGKNAVFKGISLKDKATGRQRNRQVGGHNA